jgi:DNA-binding transcriptional LysR family regulator
VNLRQIDLNLLVALDVLLAERNVTRAGERLIMSQSAMSGILARLRATFGDELLVRAGRHLELTAFAMELAGPLHECVRQLEDLVRLRQPFVPDTSQCSFHVVASDYVILVVLEPLLRSVATLAPNVSMHFVNWDPSVSSRLSAGELDFAILPPWYEPDLPSITIFEDSWICAVWSGHAHTGERFTMDEFLAQSHLIFRPPGPDRSVVRELFEDCGLERKVTVSTESMVAVPLLLRGTSMVTLIPRRLGERLRRAADIRLVEPPLELPPFRESLIWSTRFSASAAHEWVRARFVEVAASL